MAGIGQKLGAMFAWSKSDRIDNEDNGGVATATAEPGASESPTLAPTRGVGRQAQIENAVHKLESGYREVRELLVHVRGHMENQADRSERLLTLMQHLPDAVQSLPEAARNQERLMRTIESHLERAAAREARLADAMSSFAQSVESRDKNMQLMYEQLSDQRRQGEELRSSFKALNQTLGELSDSSSHSSTLLRSLTHRSEQRDEQVADLYRANQKQMVSMSMVSWALAIVALCVAGYVAASIARIGPGDTASSTSAATASSPSSATPTPAPAAPIDPASGDGATAAASIAPVLAAPETSSAEPATGADAEANLLASSPETTAAAIEPEAGDSIVEPEAASSALTEVEPAPEPVMSVDAQLDEADSPLVAPAPVIQPDAEGAEVVLDVAGALGDWASEMHRASFAGSTFLGPLEAPIDADASAAPAAPEGLVETGELAEELDEAATNAPAFNPAIIHDLESAD